MRETNLNVFYHFGASMEHLYQEMHAGIKAIDLVSSIVLSQKWITAFLGQTSDLRESLRESHEPALQLRHAIDAVFNSIRDDVNHVLSQEEVSALISWKDDFETKFEREHRSLAVFTVMPKGIIETRLLVSKAEEKFSTQTRSVFDDRVIYDLQQAGRCLAFELPTAMAFHIMRATESIIKKYYEVLAGGPWPHAQRDWGRYISELENLTGVNKVITGRLMEIKNLNRNPLIHPEEVIPLEEAPIMFDLCNGVIYYMAVEIRKRKT